MRDAFFKTLGQIVVVLASSATLGILIAWASYHFTNQPEEIQIEPEQSIVIEQPQQPKERGYIYELRRPKEDEQNCRKA